MLKDFENPSLNWQNESVETKPHFTCNMNFDSCTDARPRDRDTRAGINSAPDDEIKMRFDQRRSSAPSNNETALHEYLQRQDAMSILILRLKSVMMARISRLSSMKTRFAGS